MRLVVGRAAWRANAADKAAATEHDAVQKPLLQASGWFWLSKVRAEQKRCRDLLKIDKRTFYEDIGTLGG